MFTNYLIFGSYEKAVEFIEKLKKQNIAFKMEAGYHYSLGMWFKVNYANGYKLGK